MLAQNAAPAAEERARLLAESTAALFAACESPTAERGDLEHAFAAAWALAREYGSADDVMTVGWTYGWRELQDGRAERAQQVFGDLENAPQLSTEQRVYVRSAVAEARLRNGDVEGALALADAAWGELDPQWPSASNSRAELQLVRGAAHLALGLIDRAFGDFDAAAREPACEGDVDLRARVALARCNILLAIEGYDAIAAILTEGFLDVLRDEAPDTYVAALVRLATAESERARNQGSNGDAALALLERADAAVTAGFPIEPHDRVHADLVHVDLALRPGELELASTLLARLEHAALDDAALSARRAALRASLSLARADDRPALLRCSDDLQLEIERFSEHWKRTALRKGGRGFLHWGTQRLLFSEWLRVQLALDPTRAGVERALEPVLRAHGLATLAREAGWSASLAQILEVLAAPDRGVLIYLPAMDRSHVFCIDAADVTLHTLASGDRLDRIAQALELAWARPPDREPQAREQRRRALEGAARAGFAEFLPPSVWSRVERWSTCVVVGSDLTSAPAFECLLRPDGQWLGLTHGLVYLDSTALGLGLAARASVTSGPVDRELVVLGAPTHSPAVRAQFPSLAPIEWSARDERALTSGFDERRSVALWRGDATLDALRSALSGPSRVLALFAHGVYGATECAGSARPASLLLAPGARDDGVVCCDSVEQLALPPLVELLSCGAARGPLRKGDGSAAHLVGACFEGGAHTVLASRVNVGTDATLELARRFHHYLRAEGRAPAAALLQARRELAAAAETSDPWCWAPLALYGAGWTPIFEASSAQSDTASRTNARTLAAALAAASVVVVFVWRRRVRANRRQLT